MKKNKAIQVTQPDLPPIEEVKAYLDIMWENKWLTNGGPLHEEFEQKLAEFLGVPYVSLFANGTLALLIALRSLDIEGEVITTPYSFVATAHALQWNNIKPVFVDIEPVYGNLNPEKIEAAITEKTTAIVPVHVYGNPCNVEQINEIAKKHGLKVIYDAAHAFGVTYKGQSILNFGDLSVLSFHATKGYNTFEGGAIICHDAETKKQINFLKNFGFTNDLIVDKIGINAKMNEFQAAVGLLNLNYVNENINTRKSLDTLYRDLLAEVSGVEPLPVHPACTFNYNYFPVFIDDRQYGKTRDDLYFALRSNNILVRRYFYPLIANFKVYEQLPSSAKDKLPVANQKSAQVICLPMYTKLEADQVEMIVDFIKSFRV
ncbi:MAG: DegT/DnrJ/EryC1/StrS family aminotransferase [Bacteroidetes bacterium]|nr:MAG: DegT/DnrJ/EryC1/StrS family aminotransferase [Bacteroidota bacterium]